MLDQGVVVTTLSNIKRLWKCPSLRPIRWVNELLDKGMIYPSLLIAILLWSSPRLCPVRRINELLNQYMVNPSLANLKLFPSCQYSRLDPI